MKSIFRKSILILGAVAALGAAALAPTSASAWGGGWKHHHHRWHGGFYGTGFGYVGGSDCYYVKRIVDTPYGLRTKRFLVCN